MYVLNADEKMLLSMLKALPCGSDEIPNERENLLIFMMLDAVTDKRVNEFIGIISDNPGISLQEFVSILYEDERVEITDDEEEDDE